MTNNPVQEKESMNISDIQQRTCLMLGYSGIKKLQQAHILIAGCGAVGGMAAEALVRTGIGKITLVDFDTISPSNLNRQIFATINVINHPKTTVAKERLLNINPHLTVIEKQILLNGETISSLFDEPVDFVIDAIDSLNPKTLLIEELVNRKIPFISSMGAALKTDISRLKVSSMKKTIQCPLAAFVRKRLRRRQVDLSFPVVWSDECVSDKTHLGEIEINGQSERHTMGSLMTITGTVGLMCAHEAILFLTQSKQSFYHGYF